MYTGKCLFQQSAIKPLIHTAAGNIKRPALPNVTGVFIFLLLFFLPYGQAYFYSVLKLFTGLAVAARRDV